MCTFLYEGEMDFMSNDYGGNLDRNQSTIDYNVYTTTVCLYESANFIILYVTGFEKAGFHTHSSKTYVSPANDSCTH